MSGSQVRSLLAATAVASVLTYGVAGHGVSPIGSHEHMTGVAAAGLCVLLAVVLVYVDVPVPGVRRPTAAMRPAQGRVGAPPRPRPDGRQRASPRALQRFRN